MRKEPLGVIHARFQPLHLGHMEYLLAAKERCEHLIIGITNPDPTKTRTTVTGKHRSLASSNPYTYYERYQMIKESLLDAGINRDEFEIVPFPVNSPEILKFYVPMDALFFVTMYEDWSYEKVKILRSLGTRVEVTWERNVEEHITSGSEIRKLIVSGKEWKHLVPKPVAKIIEKINLEKRIENNTELNNVRNSDFIYDQKLEIGKHYDSEIFKLHHKILPSTAYVKSHDYGGKASWLSWLTKEGYSAPYSVFIPVKNKGEKIFTNNYDQYLFKQLIRPFQIDVNSYDVAIRSSATLEDSKQTSLAGHFDTFIGKMSFDELLNKIEKVINSLENFTPNESVKMGVIIQKKINPLFSGVAFSSDPISGAKFQTVINVKQGEGSDLVSGKVSGDTIIVTNQGDRLIINDFAINIERNHIEQIFHICKKIENQLQHPVDLEWCIDNNNKLVILQCRPISNLTNQIDNTIFEICVENEEKISRSVVNNDKVILRLKAEKYGILVPKAYLVNLVSLFCSNLQPQLPDLSLIKPNTYCRGYSIVLLYPQRIDGKIIRFFAPSQPSIVKTCQRYITRHYTDNDGLANALTMITQKTCSQYWKASIIVQQMFKPKYMGIIQKIDNKYLIEIGRGHFIEKGVITPSQYIITKEGEIVFSKEFRQPKFYDIVGENIIEEINSENNALISLPRERLHKIMETFSSFIEFDRTTLEFGILDLENSNEFIPYLIDFVNYTNNENLRYDTITEGIISNGVITGEVEFLEIPEDISQKSNFHFHDKIEFNTEDDKSRIFYCKRPDISLLKIIQKHDPKKIGFIFNDASLLCHLSIILREKGIPAIQVGNAELKSGDMVKIDAITLGLSKERRITHVPKPQNN